MYYNICLINISSGEMQMDCSRETRAKLKKKSSGSKTLYQKIHSACEVSACEPARWKPMNVWKWIVKCTWQINLLYEICYEFALHIIMSLMSCPCHH